MVVYIPSLTFFFSFFEPLQVAGLEWYPTANAPSNSSPPPTGRGPREGLFLKKRPTPSNHHLLKIPPGAPSPWRILDKNHP